MVIMLGLKNFFYHFYNALSSIFTFLIAIISYLIGYPARVAVLTMVLVFFILDVITKIFAISMQNGGLIKAFVNGKISSRSFWNGFIVKVLGYTVILITANFATITPEINFVGNAVSSILYGGLFFYEVISNLENLVNAGFIGLTPILNKFKKEQDKFLETSLNDIKDSATQSTTINNNEDI